MKIQSVNYNQCNYKPAFGLKISDKATKSLIKEYKRLDASDDEIVDYFKILTESLPDDYELTSIRPGKYQKSLEAFYGITFLTLSSTIELSHSKNNAKGTFCSTKGYYNHDGEGCAINNADKKHFIIEHLLDLLEDSAEKLR